MRQFCASMQRWTYSIPFQAIRRTAVSEWDQIGKRRDGQLAVSAFIHWGLWLCNQFRNPSAQHSMFGIQYGVDRVQARLRRHMQDMERMSSQLTGADQEC